MLLVDASFWTQWTVKTSIIDDFDGLLFKLLLLIAKFFPVNVPQTQCFANYTSFAVETYAMQDFDNSITSS